MQNTTKRSCILLLTLTACGVDNRALDERTAPNEPSIYFSGYGLLRLFEDAAMSLDAVPDEFGVVRLGNVFFVRHNYTSSYFILAQPWDFSAPFGWPSEEEQEEDVPGLSPCYGCQYPTIRASRSDGGTTEGPANCLFNALTGGTDIAACGAPATHAHT